MKRIVTHMNPDLDAIASVWMIKRWLDGWRGARVDFVPAGKTLDGEEPDIDPEILHVDTGLGKLDHHQTGDYTCAAKLALEFVKSERIGTTSDTSGVVGSNRLAESPNSGDVDISSGRREKMVWSWEALRRMAEVVNQVDHFQEVYYKEPEADYLMFSAESVLDGLKLLYREQDDLIVKKGVDYLDGVYISMQSKVEAEKILMEKGIEFDTKWGKGIAIETKNSMVTDAAQIRGYALTVRKHPVTKHARIKSPPENKISVKDKKAGRAIDLTEVYEKLKEADKVGDWFFHASKTMILNGSSKNPKMRATNLSLQEIVEIVKNI